MLFGAAIGYGFLFGPKNPPLRIRTVVPVALVVGLGFVKQGRTVEYDPQELPTKFLPPPS